MKLSRKIILASALVFLALSGCSQNRDEERAVEKFWRTVDQIHVDFEYRDYTEVMREQSYVLALPEKYSEIDSAKNFLVDQKLFLFKRPETDAVIVLQMTFDTGADDSWNNSIHYDSQTFNSTQSYYGDFYVEEIPDIELAVLSFTYSHCTYCVSCFSGGNESAAAATTAIDFANTLIEFIVDGNGG